jgi:2-polyprenyl-3-methyl-5-hydroxy-6-metoxy-1,4-benzoquinol methylase
VPTLIERPATNKYPEDWREPLLRCYAAHEGMDYWPFDFETAWAKFQRGVEREQHQADLVSHWLDLRGARVLVIGSWLGSEAIAYALRGAKVVGIDLDGPALELSEKVASFHGVDVEYRSIDATETPFEDGAFDYISCAQVLEHLPPEQQPKLLAEIGRICRPGGLIWLDTPNQLAVMDHHDTGLPFIHWLPRSIKVPLARWLGRSVPGRELAFGNRPVELHYYMGYFALMRTLAGFGKYRVLSRYRGYEDFDHYYQSRRRQGRAGGLGFSLKAALLAASMRLWNWNWFSGIRMMIRKV